MITFALWIFVLSLLKITIPIDDSNLPLFVILAIMSDLNWLAHIGK